MINSFEKNVKFGFPAYAAFLNKNIDLSQISTNKVTHQQEN